MKKMSEIVSKKEVLTKNEKLLAWSVNVGGEYDEREDFEIAAEAVQKSLCPRCVLNSGKEIDVSGLKACPICGRKTEQ